MTTGPVLNQRATELIRAETRSAPVRTLVDAERAHIITTLRETNWIVGGPRGAAAKLGVARTTLIARMQRLGISRNSNLDGRDTGHDHSNSSQANDTAVNFRRLECVTRRSLRSGSFGENFKRASS